MFLDGASRGGAGTVPQAALCGLAPHDEEILTLLLDILGWHCTVVSDLANEAVIGAQLVFVGREQPVPGLEALDFAQDISFVFVTETASATHHENGASGSPEILLSPIELRSAEIIINEAAAAFVSRNAN